MVAVPRDTEATSPPGEGGSQFSVFPEFKLSQSNESVHKCAEAHWEPFLPEKKSPSSEMDLDLHNSLAAVALRLLHRETWSEWEEPFSSWGRALEYGGHVLHERGTAGSDLAPLITQGLSQGTLHTCGQQGFCTLWATQAYIPWALLVLLASLFALTTALHRHGEEDARGFLSLTEDAMHKACLLGCMQAARH